MNTVELNCIIHAPKSERQEIKDILVAELASLGFHGFDESNEGLKAYISENKFNISEVNNLAVANVFKNKLEFSRKTIEEENWNENWEKSYNPVIVDDRCLVRAPFHNISGTFDHEIVIEPKMSFGTGHHATTYLMIHAVLETTLNNKKVLDIGCGTGVLAILARKKNASEVWAIDNNEWAYTNTLENIKINDTDDIHVMLGDSASIKDESFDVIYANINRNILLKDIPVYAESLNDNGILWLSGIYENDLPVIREKAQNTALSYGKYHQKGDWVAVQFFKE